MEPQTDLTMSRTRIVLASLALTAGAFAATRPFAAQEPQMPEVTAQHKHVLAGVGEWEGTFTMFMPGSEPMVYPCQETVVAVGDYWTTSSFRSDMGGMPFAGASTLGYDSEKKQFVGTWLDSTSTSLTIMHGEHNADSNTLVMRWQGPNWMGDGSLVDFRMESVQRGDAMVSSFSMGDGPKHMEIKMKRKAAK